MLRRNVEEFDKFCLKGQSSGLGSAHSCRFLSFLVSLSRRRRSVDVVGCWSACMVPMDEGRLVPDDMTGWSGISVWWRYEDIRVPRAAYCTRQGLNTRPDKSVIELGRRKKRIGGPLFTRLLQSSHLMRWRDILRRLKVESRSFKF